MLNSNNKKKVKLKLTLYILNRIVKFREISWDVMKTKLAGEGRPKGIENDSMCVV